MLVPFQLLILSFSLLASASLGDQASLLPPVMVQDPFQDSIFTPVTTTKPTLTDLLTIESSASIYFSYARETAFSEQFSVDGNQWTLLVPTNKAVMGLERKPHQGTAAIESELSMSEEQLDKHSKRNVERWVAAHIIPLRISFSDSPATYNTLLEGKSVTFSPIKGKGDSPDWSKVMLEDGIHIIGMREGGNGIIYMIDGTITPN